MDTLHVNCDSCVARGAACQDCVITVLLGAPTGAVDFEPAERSALAALAESGLVPPLRLVPGAKPAEPVQTSLEWRDYA